MRNGRQRKVFSGRWGRGGVRWPAAVLVAAIVVAALPAQHQFAELHKRSLPEDQDLTRNVEMADVDGDGDLDMVFGNWGPNRLYLNDGTGIFHDATSRITSAYDEDTYDLELVDLDGDGDPDMVCHNYGLPIRIHLNDGTGTFVEDTRPAPKGRGGTSCMAFGDVDGDGDPDLVLGESWRVGGYGQNRLYVNDGTGAFTDVTGRMPRDSDETNAVTLEDVDGDGDQDMVTGNSKGILGEVDRLYLNDGTGTFTYVISQLPYQTYHTSDLSFDDVDGDGDPDLVLAMARQDRLYLNDGTGTFVDVTTGRMPASRESTNSLALGDLDGDGDPDMILGGQYGPNLYLNDGTGKFADATARLLPYDGHHSEELELGDVDGDGDLDLAIPRYQQNRLYLNEGGAFTDATASRLPGRASLTRDVALGDVDGDGDLDLVLGIMSASEPNRLLLNDGSGWFSDVTAQQLPLVCDYTSAVVLEDIDGDGDDDLVIGNDGQNRLHLNDGTGRFTDVSSTRMPADRDETRALRLGDVDEDGDLDMLFANGRSRPGPNRLYLNDGTGSFGDAPSRHFPSRDEETGDLDVGDVDGDGDLDVVFVNTWRDRGQRNRLYLNDGTGRFTDATRSRMPRGRYLARSVALGDVDGDGDLDMVFGTGATLGGRLYLNDGSGSFTDATFERLACSECETWVVALGDVDGDGDLDAVFGNYRQRNGLLLNDGGGTFVDATDPRMPGHGDGTRCMALGDVDGDGDLDVVFGGRDRSRVYVNLLRQVSTPHPVVTGRASRLVVHARHGPERIFDVALPYVSTAAARLPVPPYGTLGLDPATMFPLPPLRIPQPAGVASLERKIPGDPGLAGLPIHAQALLIQWPTTVALTNVHSDRIVQ